MATSGHDVAIYVALDARENRNANTSLDVALETWKFTKKSGAKNPPLVYFNSRSLIPITEKQKLKHKNTCISLSLLHKNTHLSRLYSSLSPGSSLLASLSELIRSSLPASLFDHLNLEVNTFILLLLRFNLGVYEP